MGLLCVCYGVVMNIYDYPPHFNVIKHQVYTLDGIGIWVEVVSGVHHETVVHTYPVLTQGFNKSGPTLVAIGLMMEGQGW